MRRLIPAAILFLLGGMGIALSVPVQADDEHHYADQVTYLHRVHPGGLNVEYAVVSDAGVPIDPPYEEYVFDGQILPGGRATYYYNPSGQPSWADPSFIPAAISMWNGYTPNMQLTYGGTTAVTSNICNGSGPDGQDTIVWGPTSGSVIAVACWYSGGECDINLGTNFSSVDMRTVLAHELGHCVGLGHPPDHPEALMYYAYHGPMAALAADDLAGLCALYGGCRAGVPTATRTNTPSVTPTGTQQPPTATNTATRTPIPPTATQTAFPTFTPTASPTPYIPRRGCHRYPGLLHCRIFQFVARDG